MSGTYLEVVSQELYQIYSTLLDASDPSYSSSTRVLVPLQHQYTVHRNLYTIYCIFLHAKGYVNP